MPELPEVETVRSGLAPHLTGTRIAKVTLFRPNLRFPFPEDFAARLEGQTIRAVGRRAKYLLFELSGGETVLSHLGMTGNFRFAGHALAAPSRYYEISPDKHDHVHFALNGESGENLLLIYSDPRRFGFMDLFTDPEASPFLKDLGPEPLGNAFDAKSLARRLAGRRAPVKAALLDQKIVAGLGNIYVVEALWRAGIAPLTPADRLVGSGGEPSRALEGLVAAIRQVLLAAIAAGGSTLRDFRNAEGETGYFQHTFDVYDRQGEACRKPGCTGIVTRIVQSGRSSFFCPVCQGELS